jgi:serine/threonine-protein kinase
MPVFDLNSIAGPPRGARTVSSDDPLLTFDAEPDPVAEMEPDGSREFGGSSSTPAVLVIRTRRASMLALTAILGAALLGVAAFAVAQARGMSSGVAAAAPTNGVVELTSQPAGAEIVIDGEPRGVTPSSLSIVAGQHIVDVTSGRMKSTLPLTVAAGTTSRQHIEFTVGTIAARPMTASEQPSAAARIDNPVARGVDIADRSETADTVGWARVTAPIALQVSEGGRVIEPTASGRLRLSPGRHDLEVSNASLDFHAAFQVNVLSGRTVSAPVAIPTGRLSLNAIPWANISIDSRPIGVTPIGNISLPIGVHEVIWRHPQLGERRQTVTVTERSPVGIGMDFSK